jgi:hypothetical protein
MIKRESGTKSFRLFYGWSRSKGGYSMAWLLGRNVLRHARGGWSALHRIQHTCREWLGGLIYGLSCREGWSSTEALTLGKPLVRHEICKLDGPSLAQRSPLWNIGVFDRWEGLGFWLSLANFLTLVSILEWLSEHFFRRWLLLAALSRCCSPKNSVFIPFRFYGFLPLPPWISRSLPSCIHHSHSPSW